MKTRVEKSGLFHGFHKCTHFTSCLQPVQSLQSPLCTSDLSASLSFFQSIIPSSLPGLVDINLEHSYFPMVLHVALHMSERETLWPTSISVTCQDLWEMESKPNSSESVLLKPTPGPLCNVIDERTCALLPTHHISSLLLQPSSAPASTSPGFFSSAPSVQFCFAQDSSHSFSPNEDLVNKN